MSLEQRMRRASISACFAVIAFCLSNPAAAESCQPDMPTRLYAKAALFHDDYPTEPYFNSLQSLFEQTLARLKSKPEQTPAQMQALLRNIELLNSTARQAIARYLPSAEILARHPDLGNPVSIDFSSAFGPRSLEEFPINSLCFKALLKYHNLRTVFDHIDRFVAVQKGKLYGLGADKAGTAMRDALIGDCINVMRTVSQLRSLVNLLQ